MEVAFAPQLERRRAAVRPDKRKPAAAGAAAPGGRGAAVQLKRRVDADDGLEAAAVQRKPGRSGVPLFLGRALQAKLAVNPAGDRFEQEADQVAAAVTAGTPAQVGGRGRGRGGDAGGMRAEGPQAKQGAGPGAASTATAAAGSAGQVARSTVPGPAARASSPSLLSGLSDGDGLAASVRSRVEPVLGADLSHVRVHTDPEARAAAAALQARAFTHQNHIYVGADESAADLALMAHEATHVLQQAEGLDGRIQRQDHEPRPSPPPPPPPPPPAPMDAGAPSPGPQDAGGSLPGGVATPPAPGPTLSPAAIRAASTEIVELKGKSEFEPSAALAEMIDYLSPASLIVRVRFGTLASGTLAIRRASGAPRPRPPTMLPPRPVPPPLAPGTGGSRYETVDTLAYIDLTHPAFPGGGAAAPPRMILEITNSVVTGHIGFFPWDRLPFHVLPRWQRIFTLDRLLGWRGLTDVTTGSFVNEVSGGVLRYRLDNFGFLMADAQALGNMSSGQGDFPGTGSFGVVDESQTFRAETTIRANGVTDGRMPLRRAAGRIFGSTSMTLNLTPRDAFGGAISGSLTGSYADGVLTITGSGRYRSRKLNGAFTVLIAPRAVAWAHVIRQLPTGAPGISTGAAIAPGHVVVGWGSLDFHVNEWLTGRASVVVDPDGYVTSHGILRPTAEYQFLNEPGRYEINRPVGPHLSFTQTFATIGIASLNGTLEADLRAGGRIGPARLYGLEVEGQFSTRPGSIFTGRVTGRANLSAQASVAASLTGTLHGDIGTPPLSVRTVSVAVNIRGQATLRAYVELQPTFERIAGPTPDAADYRVTGALTAAGAVDLGLSGSVRFSILGVGPRIQLGRVQYPLGSIGATATISHVIGSGDPIEPEITAADFDEAQYGGFMQDLFDEAAPENEGEHEADLAQTGGRPAADTPHPTSLRTTFSMHGEPHTLWLEHTPGPVLKMATGTPGPLDEKLRAEIATVEQERETRAGDDAALLTAEAQAARSLLSRAVAVERTLGELQSDVRSSPDAAGFNELASGLSAYGAQYDKTDLAVTPPPSTPTSGAGTVRIEDGRYVITNREELEAVRNARPTRPADLDPDQDALWQQYMHYFDEKIRLIDRDLTPPRRTVRRETPQTWENYIEARGFYDRLRQRKQFQTEMRQTMLDRDGSLQSDLVEIDVGMQKGRSRVRYADVVVTDGQNNLSVYSLKVRNVVAQTQRLPTRRAVEEWIEGNLRGDVVEAIDYYGGQVRFRRRFRSTTDGRSARSGPQHHLYDQSVFVSKVTVVWRGSPDVVPAEYRAFITTIGNALGARHRRTITAEVKLEP